MTPTTCEKFCCCPPHLADHYVSELCQFLWSCIIQAELDATVEFRNTAPMRSQRDKPGPSGKDAKTREIAYELYENWGGKDCKLDVPVDVAEKMKADLGGDALLEFTTAEFSQRAQAVLDTLQPVGMTLENGWKLFRVMLPRVFPEREDFPVIVL